MTISEKGLDMIKRYEGCRLTAYKCPTGKWTIGYGHTSGIIEGMTCTAQQADMWLLQDIARSERNVNALDRFGYSFSQSQYDALVSFTYNCGAGNLLRLCDNGKRTLLEMSDKILEYNKASGYVLSGLTKRRKEESEMLKDYGNMQTPFDIMNVKSIRYAVRPNYNIRATPNSNGDIIGNTSNIADRAVSDVKYISGGYVGTEYGWICIDAFYDVIE